MSDAIVEIRDYTIDPEWFEAYRQWATDFAAPWLKANLDVIDFWVDVGLEPEVAGSSPSVSSNGQANVCWIIRWPDRAARDAGFGDFAKNPGWQAVWAKHPNPDSYLQTNVRFMKAATALA